MFVDRVIYPVTALGPGERAVIWVSGCHRQCPKCANPELWVQHSYQKITPKAAADYLQRAIRPEIRYLTISGGEPFNQAEELAEMIELLPVKPEILIFTGYRYQELIQDEHAGKLLKLTDVLIDGEYVDELNDNSSALRGSSNQTIHYLNPAVREAYENYLSEGRKIQNFIYDYRTVSVGIHNRSKP